MGLSQNNESIMSNDTLFSSIIKKIDCSICCDLCRKKAQTKVAKDLIAGHIVSMLFIIYSKSSFVKDISDSLSSETANLNHLRIQRAPSMSGILVQ
jgi:hypothetical protein